MELLKSSSAWVMESKKENFIWGRSLPNQMEFLYYYLRNSIVREKRCLFLISSKRSWLLLMKIYVCVPMMASLSWPWTGTKIQIWFIWLMAEETPIRQSEFKGCMNILLGKVKCILLKYGSRSAGYPLGMWPYGKMICRLLLEKRTTAGKALARKFFLLWYSAHAI